MKNETLSMNLEFVSYYTTSILVCQEEKKNFPHGNNVRSLCKSNNIDGGFCPMFDIRYYSTEILICQELFFKKVSTSSIFN